MSDKRGFIIDSPKVLITDTSGYLAQVIHAQSGEVTFGAESLQIQAGWDFYDLANIDTRKTVDVSITNAKFDLDMFKMQTGGTITTGAGDYTYFGDKYTIDATTYKIIIPYVVVTSSVKINGYTETTETTPTGKQFKVTVSGESTDVLFASAEAGMVVYPVFKVATPATTETLVTKVNDFPKSGSVVISFPIYSDADAEDTTIVAYGQLTIYKAKIKSDTTMSGSYKTASTFAMNLSALDPRRDDKAMWQFVYNSVA